MASKCKCCDWKIKENEPIVFCPDCGAVFHQKCYDRILRCRVCNALTPFGTQVEEKNRKEAETQYQEAAELLKKKKEQEEKIRREEELRRIQHEQAEQKEIQRKFQERIDRLKSIGRTGYYEYKVISIVDKKGAVDINRLMAELNDLGLDGWRLQCAYTNEMGKDSLTVAGFGVNSTADQNILILERFVNI